MSAAPRLGEGGGLWSEIDLRSLGCQPAPPAQHRRRCFQKGTTRGADLRQPARGITALAQVRQLTILRHIAPSDPLIILLISRGRQLAEEEDTGSARQFTGGKPPLTGAVELTRILRPGRLHSIRAASANFIQTKYDKFQTAAEEAAIPDCISANSGGTLLSIPVLAYKALAGKCK